MSDYFTELTDSELRTLLKKLQTALLQGARQIIFKDQQVVWSNTSELKERISLAQEALDSRENPNRKVKKSVRVTTRSKGFR